MALLRVAFDPDQITEAEALLRVAVSFARPLDGLRVILVRMQHCC